MYNILFKLFLPIYRKTKQLSLDKMIEKGDNNEDEDV
jgi:hypothetical protein